MGDIADMMLSGILCERCGEFLDGEETGYPRLCESCSSGDKKAKKKKKKAKQVKKEEGK